MQDLRVCMKGIQSVITFVAWVNKTKVITSEMFEVNATHTQV